MGLGSWYWMSCYIICLSLGRLTSSSNRISRGFITGWNWNVKNINHGNSLLICTNLGKQTTGCSWFLPWLSLKFFINHFWNGKKVYHFSWLETTLENKNQPSHTFTSKNLLNLLYNLQSLHNTTRTIPAPKTQQNTQVMWCHVSLRSPNYIGQGGAQKPCERNEGGGCHKAIKTICPVGLGPRKYISAMWFC